jgi:single-strand DNA-binding protein
MNKNSVNKAIIVGRIGQAPELKYTPSQMAVTNISVATTESMKDKDDLTEWHRVTAFGKTAEFVCNYLTKGILVYVEGRLQTRSWEDKDGVKKYTTEIIAQTVTPLGASKEQKEAQNNPPEDSEVLPF